MVNECIPYYEPGTRIPASVKTGKTVTGKRFVVVGADTQNPFEGLNTGTSGGNVQIEHAAAKALSVLGVSSHDAAAGDKVTVLREMVVPVEAGGNITAGEQIGVGANGTAVKAELSSEAEIKEGKGPYKVPPVGYALNSAEAEDDVAVALYH